MSPKRWTPEHRAAAKASWTPEKRAIAADRARRAAAERKAKQAELEARKAAIGQEPDGSSFPETPAPAFLSSDYRAPRIVNGLVYFDAPSAPAIHPGREIKMFVPSCGPAKMEALGLPEDEACQMPHNIFGAWWEKCPHDPYFALIKQVSRKPNLVEIAPGRMKLDGYQDEEVWFDRRPNIRQISMWERINSGAGPQLYRTLGYKESFEVNFDAQGNHVAPFCEFRDCWSQALDTPFAIHHPEYGHYCNRAQASLVAADVLGVRLEVMTDDYGLEKRRKQLADINLR